MNININLNMEAFGVVAVICFGVVVCFVIKYAK